MLRSDCKGREIGLNCKYGILVFVVYEAVGSPTFQVQSLVFVV